MQVILVCILCRLLPLVDLDILVKVFLYTLEIRHYLSNQCMYRFTTTFQLVQPINAEIFTLVYILCEIWPLMDLQTLEKAYHTVTTTIFEVKKLIVERAVLWTALV